jgi:hypothetical protein
MKKQTYKLLLQFSVFFLALWFFGNLYEEILLAPNHVRNSYQKLSYWHQYFTDINQIYYYVPFTQISVFVLFFLLLKTKEQQIKSHLKSSSITGGCGLVVTAVIVLNLNFKLYIGNNLDLYKGDLQMLSILWLIGNAIRLALVGAALLHAIKAYLILEQHKGAEINPSI